jgi:hypothetical protein
MEHTFSMTVSTKHNWHINFSVPHLSVMHNYKENVLEWCWSWGYRSQDWHSVQKDDLANIDTENDKLTRAHSANWSDYLAAAIVPTYISLTHTNTYSTTMHLTVCRKYKRSTRNMVLKNTLWKVHLWEERACAIPFNTDCPNASTYTIHLYIGSGLKKKFV